MNFQFVQQVEILMKVRQFSQFQVNNQINEKPDYLWLKTSKKCFFLRMTQKQENQIIQATKQLDNQQLQKVMSDLIKWFEANPDVESGKIPEYCIHLLNNVKIDRVLHEVTFRRMNSFRSSLRRISIFSNRVNSTSDQASVAYRRKSVRFNDVYQVYSVK